MMPILPSYGSHRLMLIICAFLSSFSSILAVLLLEYRGVQNALAGLAGILKAAIVVYSLLIHERRQRLCMQVSTRAQRIGLVRNDIGEVQDFAVEV